MSPQQILTTVMTNIVVDKSTDNAEPLGGGEERGRTETPTAGDWAYFSRNNIKNKIAF